MAFAPLLFPGLPERPWKLVDLNEQFVKRMNPKISMRSLKRQRKLLDAVSENHTVYTYGGFGEDRKALWNGFEKSVKQMAHLGVDFNQLPPAQPVTIPCSGIVRHVLLDHSPHNGWGGRVIVECADKRFVLFGHLVPNAHHLPKMGDELKAGAEVGLVGSGKINGGWFPHLHLQVMTEAYIAKHKEWNEIDGYDFQGSLEGVIDPMKWLESFTVKDTDEEKK